MKLKKKSTSHMTPIWRVYGYSGMIVILFGLMLYRLVFLQMFSYDKYRALAQSQHFTTNTLEGDRGEIYVQDYKNNTTYPIAVNKTVYDVSINPLEVQKSTPENQLNLTETITTEFGIAEPELKTKIQKLNDLWEPIKTNVEEEKINNIKSKKIVGIHMEPHKKRYYPEGGFASHVLGFVGVNQDKKEGRYGVEQYYNDILQGKTGFEKKETDARGNWISSSEKVTQEAIDGQDLVLTIDHTIQYKVEEVLKNLVDTYKAKGASGIIMNSQTGALYSLANYPTFDPNNFAKEKSLNVFLDPAISASYEPGSIFKPIVMAIGLDLNKVQPTSTYIDRGALTLNGYTIKNSDEKAHGKQTMTNVLEKSLNTGVAYVEQQVGHEAFVSYLDKFGFSQKTGVDLPGEANNNIANLKKAKRDVRDINYATASFGQGVAVTPIRMLTSFNALINGGKIVKPYVLDERKSKNGDVKKTETEVISQVITKESSDNISKMLVSVVQNGHPKKAGVEGYSLGGKTGTAQIPDPKKGGYGEDTNQSFVEFGTLSNPKFSLLIKLDSPQGVKYADGSVVPVMHDLNKFLLSYFEINPD